MRSSMIKTCVSALAVFALLPAGLTAATAVADETPASTQVCTDVPNELVAVPGSDSNLKWHFKDSWMNYILNINKTDGKAVPSEGAKWWNGSAYSDDVKWKASSAGKADFVFPVKNGSYNKVTKETQVELTGKVHFQAHFIGGKYWLDMTLSNPIVRLGQDGNGAVSFEVTSNDLEKNKIIDYGRVDFQTLSSSKYNVSDNNVTIVSQSSYNHGADPALGEYKSLYENRPISEFPKVALSFIGKQKQECVEKPAETKPADPEQPGAGAPGTQPGTTPTQPGKTEQPGAGHVSEAKLSVKAQENKVSATSFTQGVAANLDLAFTGAPEGSKWNVELHSEPVKLGVVTVKNGHAILSLSAEETAKFTPGEHHLVFTSLDNKSNTFSLPWTVKAKAKAKDKDKSGAGATPTQPGTTPTQPGTTPTQPGTTPTQPGTTPTQPGTSSGQSATTSTQSGAGVSGDTPKETKTNVQIDQNQMSVTGGKLNWGLRKSFTTYIRGLAKGNWALSNGASWSGSQFGFAATSGNFNTSSNSGIVNYAGTVHFTGHHGILDVTFSNPSLKINGNTASMYLNVKSSDMSGNKANYGRVHFANVKLSQVAFRNGTLSLSSSSVSLTANGAKAFAGFYQTGEALDNLNSTVKLTVSAKVDQNGNVSVIGKDGKYHEATITADGKVVTQDGKVITQDGKVISGLAATGVTTTSGSALAILLAFAGVALLAARRRAIKA